MKFLINLSIVFTLLVSCSDNNPVTNQDQIPISKWEEHAGFNSEAENLILFASSRNLGTSYSPSLYMLNSESSQMQAITPNHISFSATWSPNKWKFLFIGYENYSQKHRSLFISDFDGSNIKRITELNKDVIGTPSWSPDGNKIAFVEKDTTYQYWRGRIIISDPDGENQTIITDWLNNLSKTSWSNDSQVLYFNCLLDGKESIYQINSNGGELSKTFEFNYSCYSPTVSPNNVYIAFASFASIEGEYKSKIFLYNMYTKEIKMLNLSKNSDFSPSWTYDSKNLVIQTRNFIGNGNFYDSIIRINIKSEEVKILTNPEAIDYNPCAYK